MRVQVLEMTAGFADRRPCLSNRLSESSGVFFRCAPGTPRPFREPGLDLYDYLFLTDKEKEAMKKTYPKLRPFRLQPRAHQVETRGAGRLESHRCFYFAELKNVTACFITPTVTIRYLPTPITQTRGRCCRSTSSTAQADQFLIAGMNLENSSRRRDPRETPPMRSFPTEALEKG